MANETPETYEEALEAFEDLISALQEVHHKINTVENFHEPGVVDSLIESIEEILTRYDSLE